MRRTVYGAVLLTVPGLLAGQSVRHESQPVRYEVADSGNEARFLVREQLAGATLPNDAIGRTAAVTGAIVLDAQGKVVAGSSEIRVDLRTLQSDQPRRDNYIKRRTLIVDSFPFAVFRVRELRGLPADLPAGRSLAFSVVGDLTVHGVTAPAVWSATAHVAEGGAITGRAETRFTFGTFGMQRPRVMVVLSVEDEIRLEYDFRFVREEVPADGGQGGGALGSHPADGRGL